MSTELTPEQPNTPKILYPERPRFTVSADEVRAILQEKIPHKGHLIDSLSAEISSDIAKLQFPVRLPHEYDHPDDGKISITADENSLSILVQERQYGRFAGLHYLLKEALSPSS